MVYCADAIPGAEDLAAHKILATLIRFNLRREYSKLCGFVGVMISLAIMRSNSQLIHGPRDKEALIHN